MNRKIKLITLSLLLANLVTACGTTSKNQKAVNERTSHFDKYPYQNNDTHSYMKDIMYKSNDDKQGKSSDGAASTWNPKKEYEQGETVFYNGTKYEAGAMIINKQPDESWEWKVVGGATPKWNPIKYYFNGDIVTYNGVKYRAIASEEGKQPNKSWQWKAVNEARPELDQKKGLEWDPKKEYEQGETVFYNGTKYEAGAMITNKQPDESWQWKAVGGTTPEWNSIKYYFGGDIVTYNGVKYRAIASAEDKQPDKSENTKYWMVLEQK